MKNEVGKSPFIPCDLQLHLDVQIFPPRFPGILDLNANGAFGMRPSKKPQQAIFINPPFVNT